jgi:flagellin-like protein
MSGKGVTKIERRQRFRRVKRKERAVSPVVATLILILIAVAAAAGLYLWLTGWQANVTKSIGQPSIPTAQFSVGGSTTVYPLSELAISWFEQNNSGTKITDQQGGSVAGAEAYCHGQVTVGAASSSFTTAQLEGDGCSTALATATVQNVVAVDAIVGIVNSANTGVGGGAGQVSASSISFNASVMLALYLADSSTPFYQNVAGGLNSYTAPAALCGAGPVIGYTGTPAYGACSSPFYGHSFEWSQIPFPAGCAVPTAGEMNFTACHYMTANTNHVNAYDRQDSSGTEQGFTQKYLLNGANLAKDGSGNSCGTDNQLESCGITVTHELGNPALAAAVAGDKNALGFNSYGQATAQSGVTIASYMSSSNSAPVFPTAGLVLGAYRGTVSASNAYGPWRPLEYLTDGTPTNGSIVSNYLAFVGGPEVNLNLGAATGYISLYAA